RHRFSVRADHRIPAATHAHHVAGRHRVARILVSTHSVKFRAIVRYPIIQIVGPRPRNTLTRHLPPFGLATLPPLPARPPRPHPRPRNTLTRQLAPFGLVTLHPIPDRHPRLHASGDTLGALGAGARPLSLPRRVKTPARSRVDTLQIALMAALRMMAHKHRLT